MSVFPRIVSRANAVFTGAYHYFVPHAYHLGGFQIFRSPGINLDPLGLNWVRSFILWHERDQVGYRMVDPEDLPELLGHPFPSEEQVREIYGEPVAYENLRNFR